MTDGVYRLTSVSLVVCVAIIPAQLLAAPLNMTGNVSLSSISTQSSDVTVTNRFVAGNLAANSYIYQPWLVTWNGSASVSRNTSESDGTSGSRGTVTTGAIDAGILPRSRFPLTIGYRVSDSAVQALSEASPDGRLTDARSKMLTVRQSYSMIDGAALAAWYTRNEWTSTGGINANNSLSEAAGANTMARTQSQSITFAATAFKTENRQAGSHSENTNLSISHQYTPQPQSGLTTLITMLTNSNSQNNAVLSDGRSISATSNYYWRPDYRPISLNGGMVARDQQMSGGNSAQALSVNLGMSYTFSRSLRAHAGVGASINQTGDVRSGMANQSVGLAYTGDSIYLGKASYSWGTSMGAGNTMSRGAGADSDKWSVNGGFNHTLQRSWQPTERQVFTLAGSQGVTQSWADTGRSTTTLSNSLRTNWSHNNEDSSTTAWMSISDARQLGDEQTAASSVTVSPGSTATATQTLTASVRRTQNVNRLSNFVADLTMNARRQEGSSASVGTNGTAEYNHSRLFGVYQLRFRTALVLSQASATQGSQLITSRWDNRLDYNIGMMSLGASFNVVQSGSAKSRALMFQMTRRF